jgi:hypothetical protein
MGETWPPLKTVSTALGTTALGDPWPPLQSVSTALGTTALGESPLLSVLQPWVSLGLIYSQSPLLSALQP